MKKRNPGRVMVSFGCGLAQIVFVATLCSSGNSAQDQWVILLPPQSGAVTASTTRRDLVNRLGAINVSDGDVGVGEGETAPGTTVFPGDPIRAMDILWKDPKTKRSPHSLSIGGKASQWKTAHGISLGTSERIGANQREALCASWIRLGLLWHRVFLGEWSTLQRLRRAWARYSATGYRPSATKPSAAGLRPRVRGRIILL
jgi:hypothetical protein